MRKIKVKKELPEGILPEASAGMEETPVSESTEIDSIQDFIELKRLQNRILEKMIGQISNPEEKEKKNNKQNK